MTASLDRLSESQSQAEAAAKSAYRNEYRQQRPMRLRPRGLMELLHWFEAEWQDQAPDDLHRFDVWRDYVAANEAWLRRGGGSRLGTPAWSEAMRRLLEAPHSADQDGYYLHPLAAAMARIERRDSYMAAFLRAVALAGFQVSPVGMRCGLPESVTMIYAVESLNVLWRAYCVEVPARPLTGVVEERVSSRQSHPELVTEVSAQPPPAGGLSPAIAILRRIA